MALFVLLHNSYAGMKDAVTKHRQSGLWPDRICVHAAAIKLSKRNGIIHHSWGTAFVRGVCVMLLQNWTRCYWAIWECIQLWMRDTSRLTNAVDFMSVEHMANFKCRTKGSDIYRSIWLLGLASLVNINTNTWVIGRLLMFICGRKCQFKKRGIDGGSTSGSGSGSVSGNNITHCKLLIVIEKNTGISDFDKMYFF